MLEITVWFAVIGQESAFNAVLILEVKTYHHSRTSFYAWHATSTPVKDTPIVNLKVDDMSSVRNESIEELGWSAWRINIVAKLLKLGYIIIEYFFSFPGIHLTVAIFFFLQNKDNI